MKAPMIELGPFLGPVTSVDKGSVPAKNCQDTLNCRYEDGILRQRYGYDTVVAAQAGFSAYRGFNHVGGYSGAYVSADEYISFEKITTGSKIHPYSIHPTTWGRTEITTPVPASIDLYDSANWQAVAFDQYAYLFNPDAAAATQLYRYTLGDVDTAVAISNPPTPTARMTAGATANDTISMAGLDPSASGEVACTAPASNTGSTFSDPIIYMRHTAATGASAIEIILSGTTGGARDWYWNDAFYFQIMPRNSSAMVVDPGSIVVTLSNDNYDSGGVVTATPEILAYTVAGSIMVRCWWDKGKTRAKWGDGAGTGHTAKIKIAYTLTKNTGGGVGNANSEIYFIFRELGWTRTIPESLSNLSSQSLTFAYSYYNSTTLLEGEFSPVADVPFSTLNIPNPDGPAKSEYYKVGYRISLVFAATGSADKARMYVKDSGDAWRRVTTVNDTSSPYSYYLPYASIIDLDEYKERVFDTTRKIVAAAPFKGSMVFMYAGGKENLKYSRVGAPLAQWSAYDELDDVGRGATFSMADDFGDQPLNGHQVGDAFVSIGSKGIYAQFGDYPSSMTPTFKLPGSFGCAGKNASARWHDENGNAVIVYVDQNADGLWLAYPVKDNVSRVPEQGALVRGLMRSFLLTAQSLAASDIKVGVDQYRDSLWLVAGKRAMVLRKPSLIDGKRQWELYEFTMGANVSGIAFNPQRGLKWMEADGTMDEIERNVATGAYYTDDDGTAIPQGWWKSKQFKSPWSRLGRVWVDRTDTDEEVRVHADSDRQSSDVYVLAGKSHIRFGAQQQGYQHEVTVYAPVTTDGIAAAEVYVLPAGAHDAS